jgi:hypothetical protein
VIYAMIFGALCILLGDAAVLAAITEQPHAPTLAGWLGIALATLVVDAFLLLMWWLLLEVNW